MPQPIMHPSWSLVFADDAGLASTAAKLQAIGLQDQQQQSQQQRPQQAPGPQAAPARPGPAQPQQQAQESVQRAQAQAQPGAPKAAAEVKAPQQAVIIPGHLQVAEADQTRLSFGTFGSFGGSTFGGSSAFGSSDQVAAPKSAEYELSFQSNSALLHHSAGALCGWAYAHFRMDVWLHRASGLVSK